MGGESSDKTRTVINGQPTGIIRCLPKAFLEEAGGEKYLRTIERGVSSGAFNFYVSLPSRPRIEVLHFYWVLGNKVRYRFNIISYDPGDTRRVASGKMWTAKCWVNLGAPMVKPPHEIEMRGFRGFRYTEGLW